MTALRFSLVLSAVLAACSPHRSTARRADPPDSTGGTLKHPGAVAPIIRQSTVVAFLLKAADTLSRAQEDDLLVEFRRYTEKAAPDLEDAGIALVVSQAESVIVELKGGPRRVIMLSGLDYPFGYVLVEPGYPETILTGVSTDDDLMDQVDSYFGLDDDQSPDTLADPRHQLSEAVGYRLSVVGCRSTRLLRAPSGAPSFRSGQALAMTGLH
jgi:hypothetical protein